MLLCYIDESFTRDHYYLATLICPDSQALSLATGLNGVVAQAAHAYDGITPEAELHGYDIFQGRKDWAALEKLPRARIGVYDRALTVIAEHEVKVVIEGIHPTSRLRIREPHSMLMGWILERVDEYACTAHELALVIADEPGQHEQQQQYRAHLGFYRSTGTGGWKSRKITRVVDTLHFAPSDCSRLVQASDLVAFLFHRIQTKPDGDPRAMRANAKLWERIAANVLHSVHVWQPHE